MNFVEEKERVSVGRIQKPRWKNGRSSIPVVNFNLKDSDFKRDESKTRIAWELELGNEWKELQEWQGRRTEILRSWEGSRKGPGMPQSEP